ncbi:MAG TPA: tRNA lysidine(34) synthetase TilS [Proteobacteria bacterium]|nr:tRNA(Ile)-lysidine synthase [bacterium BMS3Abin14]HDL54246.1 tRNA lysidine(34) synthetase TilS [Pseudomonadota bacterium]
MKAEDFQNLVSESLGRLGVDPDQGLLVAVSGGADSLALLKALSLLQAGRSGVLTAAHLDHNVREGDSARDALAVREICRKMSVPLVTGVLVKADVRAARNRLRSLEAALREMRYSFLREAALKVGASWILTGHQADDQAETVLFRTLRAMDWRSLGGISEKEGQVLRPLLGVFRRDTEECCALAGLIPLEDRSNRDMIFSRNRLRHITIPGLNRRFETDISPLLVRLGKTAGALARWETRALGHLAGQGFDLSATAVDRGVIDRIPRCLMERAAIRMVQAVMPGYPKRSVVQQFVGCLEKGAGKVKLSDRLEIEVLREKVVLGKGPGCDRVPAIFREREWQVPGRVNVPELGAFLTASEALYDGKRVFPRGLEALVAKKGLKKPLFVRKRRPGDRFQPLGMRHSKTLKRFLMDRKVPRPDRDGLPVVTDREGTIIWIGGVEISQMIALKAGIPSEAYLLRLNGTTPGNDYGCYIK